MPGEDDLKHKPRIFLCHAEEDKSRVRELYHQLKAAGYHPWLDEESLLPGVDWEREIRRAIRNSDFFLACLSERSADKRGYVQKEIKMGLAELDQIPAGKIYLIPVRLEECEVPERLQSRQWVDFFEPDGFKRLEKALDFEIDQRQPPNGPAGEQTQPIRDRQRLQLPLAVVGLLALVVVVAVIVLDGCAGEPPPNPSRGDTWTRAADGMVMVGVPGGTFQMGSTDAEVDAVFKDCEEELGIGKCLRSWYEDESPRHSVTLDAFWIDKTEVTNAQYASCVAEGVCTPPSESGSSTRDEYYGNSQYDEHPVINVIWRDATTYCEWAGGRLPTEAEWEYAARGPDSLTFPWGNDPPDDIRLNYKQHISDTTQVGAYPAGVSWVGAMDMAGNAWEWVNDWYDNGYYSTSSGSHNPPGPEEEDLEGEPFRVLRGGSWYDDQRVVRAVHRFYFDPDELIPNRFGFRCVNDPGGWFLKF